MWQNLGTRANSDMGLSGPGTWDPCSTQDPDLGTWGPGLRYPGPGTLAQVPGPGDSGLGTHAGTLAWGCSSSPSHTGVMGTGVKWLDVQVARGPIWAHMGSYGPIWDPYVAHMGVVFGGATMRGHMGP